MRRTSEKQKQHSHNHLSKTAKRRQFLVDPNRLQLDEYMLKQIKKNKKSVKHLNRQVSCLKRQVKKLQQQHDDYMIIDRTKTQDHSQSQVTTQITRGNNRIALTGQLKERKSRCKPKISSKESSILSISSSKSSSRTNSLTSSKRSKNTVLSCSKQRLSKKIQQLKAQANLQPNQRDRIKKQVNKKIKKVCQELDVKEKVQSKIKNSQIIDGSKEQQYQRLLELLQTNKTIKSPYSPKSPQSLQSPSAYQSPNIKKINQQSLIPISQVGYASKQGEILTTYGETKTLQSTNTPFRNSQFNADNSQRQSRPDEYNACSQTNLLDSPYKSANKSPQLGKKKQLQMSKCVDVRISSQIKKFNSSASEGSGIQGIFGSPVQMKSGPVEMSFQIKDEDRRRLRELEFQFDQLVRQQLISSEPKEKQILGQTIRSVLWSISQLKGKIQNNSR